MHNLPYLTVITMIIMIIIIIIITIIIIIIIRRRRRIKYIFNFLKKPLYLFYIISKNTHIKRRNYELKNK